MRPEVPRDPAPVAPHWGTLGRVAMNKFVLLAREFSLKGLGTQVETSGMSLTPPI
jgi:hypothetical protein